MSSIGDIENIDKCREMLASKDTFLLERFDDVRIPILDDGDVNRVWIESVEDMADQLIIFLEVFTDVANTNPQRFVDGFTCAGASYTGIYRQSVTRRHVRFNPKTREKEYLIIQTLKKGFIRTVTNSAGAIVWGDARLDSGRLYPAGTLATVVGGNTDSDYYIIKWEGVDPDKLHTITATIEALDPDTFSPVIRGEELGDDYHRLIVAPSVEQDGSGTIKMTLAKPEFALNGYTNYGTNKLRNVTYMWDVPRTLAQGVIDAWAATGRSATAGYGSGDGLVNLVLSEIDNAETVYADVVTGRNCDMVDTTTYYFNVEAPDSYNIPGSSADGVSYDKRVSQNGDGTFNITITTHTRQYRTYDDILIAKADGVSTTQWKQLGLTNQALRDISSAEDGKMKRQTVNVRRDCSKDVTTNETTFVKRSVIATWVTRLGTAIFKRVRHGSAADLTADTGALDATTNNSVSANESDVGLFDYTISQMPYDGSSSVVSDWNNSESVEISIKTNERRINDNSTIEDKIRFTMNCLFTKQTTSKVQANDWAGVQLTGGDAIETEYEGTTVSIEKAGQAVATQVSTVGYSRYRAKCLEQYTSPWIKLSSVDLAKGVGQKVTIDGTNKVTIAGAGIVFPTDPAP